ncbi:hypothetical protein KDA_18000 [Dictyobacter alpinus]|uniref:HTH tetR-type domain-containing protein n=1 Tax=Dictyobacter alpinus TaxID=2014873 RepID=A0A402B4P4_9CHLR|nr:TetR/AcrR family transcriptional regulator [Dictyobacter alpinus]GCE26316.1 hypothetical protein KDA_18000 [Dictyobacter alpinus]
MEKASQTAIRILEAFLKLADERGIKATTTRAIAEEAGVNEVTIFRIFKDKENLMRQAYEHFSPGKRIVAYQLAIDTSTAAQTRSGLIECMKFLRTIFSEHPQLLLSGVRDYRRFSTLHDEMAFHALAACQLVTQALKQAAPMLRPGIDIESATFSLLGFLYTTVSWQHQGWLQMTNEKWNDRLESAIDILMAP